MSVPRRGRILVRPIEITRAYLQPPQPRAAIKFSLDGIEGSHGLPASSTRQKQDAKKCNHYYVKLLVMLSRPARRSCCPNTAFLREQCSSFVQSVELLPRIAIILRIPVCGG
jgi:hypothetical protein